ncbi:hypothetical protein BDN72DRAFT_785798 [Pluteus cervinus]|uniref:Uncharacterized protein n=1 Tax=Pluteus cervinus TaxID=181527 RepID=A0ACD3BD81_9AGAR|nr:hypothetical protein BDN72DRAFT_785798 [Pluteus cervinus]
MVFRTRNPYYLRISEQDVLPIYLYLDERHLEWMSDFTLQRVLVDLRPHILTKLKIEAEYVGATSATAAKKITVDTHRGDGYQFCYFLRKTDPHSVLVKTRSYVAVEKGTVQPSNVAKASKKKPTAQKRKRSHGSPRKDESDEQQKRRRKGKGKAVVEDSDDSLDADESDDNFDPRPRGSSSKSKSTRRTRNIDDEDFEMDDSNPSDEDVDHDAPPETMDLTIEDEEEKPKPALRLNYKGFRIYGRCLCIVVEPWPRLPNPPESQPNAPAREQRQLSAVPPDISSTFGGNTSRAKTPLFLPEETVRTAADELLSTAPYRMDDEDDDVFGGMMEMSQVLTAAGEFSTGPTADDDNEIDGAVFFGDADEIREL